MLLSEKEIAELIRVHGSAPWQVVREAVRLTAERCAAICEEECHSTNSESFILGRESCAAAIRERVKAPAL